jgi:DNA modification methylase
MKLTTQKESLNQFHGLWYDESELKEHYLHQKTIKRNGVHSLHKFYGKLIPAIPAWAIACFSKPGDLVLDPFCGSGTTLVEAILAGRKAIGIDLDPLSILISKVKTTPICSTDLEESLSKLLYQLSNDKNVNIKYKIPIFTHADINYWFSWDVQEDLALIKGNIDKIQDPKIRQFFLVVLSSIVRKVSLADPRLIKPSRNKYLEREKETFNVIMTFATAARSKLLAMSRLVNHLRNNDLYDDLSCEVLLGDAREIPAIVKDINLIVTNPPYMAAVDYVRANKLEGWWTGVLNNYEALSTQTIGSEKVKGIEHDDQPFDIELVDRVVQTIYREKPRKASVVSRFFEDMKQVFSEMARVLTPSGKIVMKISDSHYQRVFIPTTDVFVELARTSGLALLMRFIDKIDNYAMSTASAARDGVVTHDWILVFSKRGV